MKLALVTPAPPLRGGMAQYAAQLAPALGARGHPVMTAGFRRQYPDWLFPGRTQYDADPRPLALLNQPLFEPLSPRAWGRTAQAILDFQAEGVVLNYWSPLTAPGYGWVARQVSRAAGAHVTLLAHNVFPHEPLPGARALVRWLLRHCDSGLVHSEAVRRDLARLAPHLPHRVAPHPAHAVFPSSLSSAEARQRLGLPSAAPLLLFFGHVRAYKGLGVLLEALALARRALPAMHLLAAGEFYVDARPYRRQIERLDLARSVTVLDRFLTREEAGVCFAAADLVVLPYARATQSGVVPIAVAHAKPVAATMVGGLREQVVDGQTGYLVPPGDPGALAGAIRRYFTEADRASMAAAIRKLAQGWTWDGVAEALEGLMRSNTNTVG